MIPDYFHPALSPQQLGQMSSLALAHVGDAVFELLTRCHLAQGGDSTNSTLHRHTIQLVKATSQARCARAIYDDLTPQEQDVFRRGRNAKPKNISQAATREDYALSTALEALMGWLYLGGQQERIAQLYHLCLQAL